MVLYNDIIIDPGYACGRGNFLYTIQEWGRVASLRRIESNKYNLEGFFKNRKTLPFLNYCYNRYMETLIKIKLQGSTTRKLATGSVLKTDEQKCL